MPKKNWNWSTAVRLLTRIPEKSPNRRPETRLVQSVPGLEASRLVHQDRDCNGTE